MEFRRAILDDAQSIAALFQAQVPRWQRIGTDGQVEDLPYGALTVYERWLHGGPWMSIETAAIWLSHLLSGAGDPWLAIEANQIVAYAEVYTDDEGPGYGRHLFLAHHLLGAEAPPATLDHLMQFVAEQAAGDRRRLTASCSAYDEALSGLYRRYGMLLLETVQQIAVPAVMGQGFYKANPSPSPDASRIQGWLMPVGRMTSARHQWETLWPVLWQAVPGIVAQTVHRLHFSASGQEAFVALRQHLYAARTADVYCWTPKPFSAQLLVAIRDWAHRNGYRTLIFTVNERVARTLGTDVEPLPNQQVVFARDT